MPSPSAATKKALKEIALKKQCLKIASNSWVPPDLCISGENKNWHMDTNLEFRKYEHDAEMLAKEKKLHKKMTTKMKDIEMSDIEMYNKLLKASAAYAKNKSKSKSKSKSKGGRRSRRR